MNDQTPWSRLAKYIAGECSPEEKREVEEWISADPSREEFVEQLRHIWRAAGESTTDISDTQLDVESEWEELHAEMRADPQSSSSSTNQSAQDQSPSKRGPARPISRGSFLKKGGAGVVAVLVLLVAGAVLWGPWSSSGDSEGGTQYREVITERGERATLRLSDGTKVKLNAESELRFPAVFGNQDRRVVHLSGEAYFNVPTDSTWPFVVRTGNAAVNVHGTAFNVRAYPDANVQVAVKEGNVSLRTEEDRQTEKKVELSSGEVGRVRGASMIVTTKLADLETHLGWTKGRLVFEDTPLPEVAVRLERWYNLEFVIRESSLHSLRLTANLESQSLRNVLDVVTASLGIRYRIDRDKVFLMPRDRSR